MLNECGQLWASRAAQALDARLTNHVVDPSVNPALWPVYTRGDTRASSASPIMSLPLVKNPALAFTLPQL